VKITVRVPVRQKGEAAENNVACGEKKATGMRFRLEHDLKE
jgi:hypothetical protein